MENLLRRMTAYKENNRPRLVDMELFNLPEYISLMRGYPLPNKNPKDLTISQMEKDIWSSIIGALTLNEESAFDEDYLLETKETKVIHNKLFEKVQVCYQLYVAGIL